MDHRGPGWVRKPDLAWSQGTLRGCVGPWPALGSRPRTGGINRLPRDSKSPGELIAELRELVVTYAKQETVDPLRRLGRFLAFGVAGAVLLGLGGVFVVVGVLR